MPQGAGMVVIDFSGWAKFKKPEMTQLRRWRTVAKRFLLPICLRFASELSMVDGMQHPSRPLFTDDAPAREQVITVSVLVRTFKAIIRLGFALNDHIELDAPDRLGK
jgi:hypothetical protein